MFHLPQFPHVYRPAKGQRRPDQLLPSLPPQGDQTPALHEGKIFVRGDYTEEVTCVSCHMPYATKSAAVASADVVGPLARVGDIRTHLWFINTDNANYTAMFSADGTQVKKDADGHAAVTLDFVCLRCHNDKGNAFGLNVLQASDIAFDMHNKFGS
jgi:hypothetical protein